MKQIEFTRLAQQLTTLFQGKSLNTLARKSKFMQRERKVEPFKLLLSVISAFGCGKVESLADLLRSYNFMADENVAYKPFHNQLSKASFAEFMRLCTECMMEKLIQKSLNAPIKGAFSEFKRIILQDGSSFAVKEQLASVYPGRFHAISPAAVELHVTYDLLNDQLEAVTLTADTASERDHLPATSQLDDALLLADAGYFSRNYLAALIKDFARFIIKAGHQINPVIVSCHTQTRKNKVISGMKLKSMFSYLSKNQPNDLTVRWTTSQGACFDCRLLVTWNPVTKRYQYLATDLPRSKYRPAKIIDAYRLRWQIELLFK